MSHTHTISDGVDFNKISKNLKIIMLYSDSLNPLPQVLNNKIIGKRMTKWGTIYRLPTVFELNQSIKHKALQNLCLPYVAALESYQSKVVVLAR